MNEKNIKVVYEIRKVVVSFYIITAELFLKTNYRYAKEITLLEFYLILIDRFS